jgi:hypothetical protein
MTNLLQRPAVVLAAIVAGALLLLFTIPALAASHTLFGGATEGGGQVTLTSNTGNATTTDDFSGIRFTVASGTSVSELTSLSTSFNVTDDDCAAGSPRFQLRLDEDNDGDADGNVFVYLGPVPSFTGCAANTWTMSGDLLQSTETRFDLTQFGGAFYSTYDQLIAQLGDASVLSVSLVTDSGWALGDQEQTILIDNVNVNGTTYDFTPAPEPPATPSSKDACKQGGWRTFTDPSFRNQGQCVSWFNHNGS